MNGTCKLIEIDEDNTGNILKRGKQIKADLQLKARSVNLYRIEMERR